MKVTRSVPAQTVSTLQATYAAELRLLSSASAVAAKRLLTLASQRNVLADVVAVLDRSFVVPMTATDEHRLLQALVRVIPSPKRPSTKPPDAVLVRGITDGHTQVPHAFATLAQAYQRGAAVTAAPEWWFVPPNKVAMTQSDRDVLLQRLCALTVGGDRLLVPGTIPWLDAKGGYHNTAYAIADGRVLHSVDKQSIGGEEDFLPSGVHFTADPVKDWTFRWRHHRVSLEVCRDHGDGRARRALLGSSDEGVDLQLVVSSGVWCIHHVAGDGGAILVAQGDESQSNEVRLIEGDRWRDLGTGKTTEHIRL
jgi:hypothetical protein